jgi:hypothetical protein
LLFLALDFFKEAAVTSLLSDPHLYVYFLELVRACVWLLILSLVFIPLEMLFPLHKERTFRPTTLSDLGFYFVSTFLPPFVLLIPLTVAAYFAFKIVPGGWRAEVASWPIWVRGLAAFVVADFGFYWGHRWTHQFPLLWRFHSVHHDPKHVYFLISARASHRQRVHPAVRADPDLHSRIRRAAKRARNDDRHLADAARDFLGFFHPRERALALWPVRMADRDARVPSLASYAFRTAGPQLRLDAAVLGLAVRDELPPGRIA